MTKADVLKGPALETELASLADWKNAGTSIQAGFTFPSFRHALAFMTLVGLECETLDHHPDWSNSYNKVDVSLSTHAAGKQITRLDIHLAGYISKASRDLQGVPDGH
jgi:4a-hydroxytetrahydrobiopterin dehydratase